MQSKNQRPLGIREFTDAAAATRVDIAIVGAGAAGLIAALAAHESGASVMVFERDKLPAGSTSLSAGLIPAAGTRWQQTQGIADNAQQLTDDIINKSHCEADRPLANAAAQCSAEVLHWLADRWEIPLTLVEGFTYPGHQVRRMHGTPARTGTELLGALVRACESAGIDLVTDTRVTQLLVDHGSVCGVGCDRGDLIEWLGADAVVLACNGYGGNPALVARHLPQMQQALYFGHAGNTGDAVLWGEQLDAGITHMSACQGHGSVATPHGILITWAVMMEGGIQVNTLGQRFSNEHAGYSEQAIDVQAQPDAVAWNIFDQRIFDIAMQFEDFRQAQAGGALLKADDIADLSAQTRLPVDALTLTISESAALAAGNQTDSFGRHFSPDKQLSAPYYAVRVQAALFHTQGGLEVDERARVLRSNGQLIPGLYAAGGAARGVSGDTIAGYLSGNGLLTAVTLGYLAGRDAAGQSTES